MTALKTKPEAQPELLPPMGQKSERNMGVELFRIVSMLLVILLHVMGHGGVYTYAEPLSTNYMVAWFLETVGYCSVNCYAIISGFANVKTKFKFRRFVHLWIETVVLILTMTAIAHFFIPSVEVQREWWIAAIFPMAKRELWYICAYFLLFPLMPLLNKGLHAISKWQHIAIIFWLQVPTVIKLIVHKDSFGLSGGYSTIWLISLYVIGAYFRMYGAPKWAKWFVTLPAFFLCAAAAWFKMMYIEKQASLGLVAKDSVLYEYRDDLISYVSPLMVIMSVMLLLFFMQLQIKGKPIKWLIANLAKATWGVFVLHVCSAGWYWYELWHSFRDFADYPTWKMVLCSFGAIAAIYLATSLLTLAKIYLFKLLRIDRGIEFLADLPAKLIEKQKKQETDA